MNQYLVRRRLITLGAMAAAILLTACQDKRLKKLTLGITRDSAVTIIAQGYHGASDSFPNVYVREAYLTGGKFYDVLYYTPDNSKISQRRKKSSADTVKGDSVPWKKLTPLVFYQNKLISKDWATWDSISKSINLPVKKRD